MHSSAELSMIQNATMLMEWVRGSGYTPWYLKTMGALSDVNIVADRGRCHLFLLPNGEIIPDVRGGLEQGEPLDKVRLFYSSKAS
jgi:hypothetical protein